MTSGSIAKDSDGKIVILVKDSKIPPSIPPSTPPENPPTADYFTLYVMLFNLFILGFGCGIAYLRKYNVI